VAGREGFEYHPSAQDL